MQYIDSSRSMHVVAKTGGCGGAFAGRREKNHSKAGKTHELYLKLIYRNNTKLRKIEHDK